MGKKGPLTYVSPSDFRDRTSVWGRRAGAISKVDAAYDEFYKNTRSLEAIQKLNAALTTYLAEKGGHWDKVERDKESGGLMRWLHESTGAIIVQLLGATNTSSALAAKKALARRDIPHSRYGVLYLFGNIDIDMNYLSISLEGVAAAGGAIGHGVSTNFDRLSAPNEVQKTFNMGAIKDVRGGDFAGHLGVPFNVANKVAARTGTQLPTDVHFATRADSTLDLQGNARGFSVHRVAPTAAQALPGFPTTRRAFDALAQPNLNPMVLIPGMAVGVAMGAAALDLLNNLRVAVTNLANDFIEWLRKKLLTRATWGWEISGAVVSKLVNFIVGKCLAAAAPFVGAGMDLVGGVAKTIKAAKDRIEAFMLRRQINLTPGHPEIAANSIESAMTMGMLQGLWSALKGAAQVALSVFLPGAGSLVSALVTGLEWLVKFVYRLWEQSNIRQFLTTAREHFAKELALAHKIENYGDFSKSGIANQYWVQYEPELDPGKGGFIHKFEEFKAFYQKGCDASPLIPMLTFNTGICGSLMVLLKMVDDTETDYSHSDKSVISQSEFDAGTKYFEHLKAYGRNYLDNSGFMFTARNQNKSVQGLLNHAVQHHTKPYSKTDKVLSFGSGMAS